MLVSLVACAVGCDTTAPLTYAEFAAPPLFDTLWAQINTCSELPRPMTVRFGVVTSTETVSSFKSPHEDRTTDGLYIPEKDIILVAPYVVMAWIPDSNRNELIRHEMLHAHLPGDHGYSHPAVYFAERCGALVRH
jgi:hypothetical protein